MSDNDECNFAMLVNQMRQRQKEYFRTRSDSALSESKRLEKQVDREVELIMDKQGRLPFDDRGS